MALGYIRINVDRRRGCRYLTGYVTFRHGDTSICSVGEIFIVLARLPTNSQSKFVFSSYCLVVIFGKHPFY